MGRSEGEKVCGFAQGRQRNLFEFSIAVSPWHAQRRTTFYFPALIEY